MSNTIFSLIMTVFAGEKKNVKIKNKGNNAKLKVETLNDVLVFLNIFVVALPF